MNNTIQDIIKFTKWQINQSFGLTEVLAFLFIITIFDLSKDLRIALLIFISLTFTWYSFNKYKRQLRKSNIDFIQDNKTISDKIDILEDKANTLDIGQKAIKEQIKIIKDETEEIILVINDSQKKTMEKTNKIISLLEEQNTNK